MGYRPIILILAVLAVANSETVTLKCTPRIKDFPQCRIKFSKEEVIDQNVDFEYDGRPTKGNLYLGFSPYTKIPKGIFKYFTKVQILHLEESALDTLTPESFEGASELKFAYLKMGNLTKIPANALTPLTSIEELDLNSNLLAEIDENAFNGLVTLDTLNLANNKLVSLPEDVFQGLERLRVLNLAGNQLETLPEGIFNNLSQLFDLELSRNPITTLPDRIFANVPETTIVRLHDTNLKKTDFILQSPMTLLLTSSQLDKIEIGLKIRHLTVTGSGLKRVRCTEGKAKIKTLDLSSNNLTEFGCISELKSLRSLTLSKNQLQEVDEDDVKGLSRIQELNLNSNRISEIDPKAFQHLSKLTRINLSDNNLAELTLEEGTIPLVTEFIIKGNDWRCDKLRSLVGHLKKQNNEIVFSIRPKKRIGLSNSALSMIEGIECSN